MSDNNMMVYKEYKINYLKGITVNIFTTFMTFKLCIFTATFSHEKLW